MERPPEEQLKKIWAQITAKAWDDETFKKKLKEDPKNTLVQEGFLLEKGIEYKILENTKNQEFLVIRDPNSHYHEWLHGSSLNIQHFSQVLEALFQEFPKNPKLKSRFFSNPKEVLKERGIELPDNIQYEVMEDTPKQKYLILQSPQDEFSISEEDLNQASGGGGASNLGTDSSC